MKDDKIRRREDLGPRTRAVSDALDEYLNRIHGVLSSWAHPLEFIDWLEKRGYVIVPEKDKY